MVIEEFVKDIRELHATIIKNWDEIGEYASSSSREQLVDALYLVDSHINKSIRKRWYTIGIFIQDVGFNKMGDKYLLKESDTEEEAVKVAQKNNTNNINPDRLFYVTYLSVREFEDMIRDSYQKRDIK